MARKKTTPTPKAEKTYTLTKEQFELLRKANNKVTRIRHIVESLRGEDDLSTIMYEVGIASQVVNDSEDMLDEIINSFDDDDDCDECDEDY